MLPWDHLGSGVTKEFLQRELAHAVEGALTPDCSIERCTYCGACDFTTVRNVTYHVHGAKGGEHRGGAIDNWAQVTVDGGDEPGSWEPRGWHKIAGASAATSGSAARRRPADAAAPRRGCAPIGRTATPAAPPSARPTRGLGNAEEWLSAALRRRWPPPRSTARRRRGCACG